MPARTDPDVTVRPLCPDDQTALQTMHEQHSAETVRLRFGMPMPHLADSEALRLLTVGDDSAALGAFKDDALIGVARYFQMEDPSRAEFAIVVTDDWQRRGIGGILLVALIRLARNAGITHFVADRLTENRNVRQFLEHCSLMCVEHNAYDDWTVECWELPAA